jgi:hypothetical protein
MQLITLVIQELIALSQLWLQLNMFQLKVGCNLIMWSLFILSYCTIIIAIWNLFWIRRQIYHRMKTTYYMCQQIRLLTINCCTLCNLDIFLIYHSLECITSYAWLKKTWIIFTKFCDICFNFYEGHHFNYWLSSHQFGK